MYRIWLAAALLIAAAYVPAEAQVVQGRVVAACGGSSHTAGSTAPFEVLPDGTLCTAASFTGDAGGTAAADDADFTAGTTDGTPAMGSYQSSPTAVTDGDLGIIGIDADRNVKVSIEADNAGIGGGVQYDVGDVAGATATGTASLVVRDDALSTLSDAEGDEVRMRVGATGALWTNALQSGSWTVDLGATDNAVLDSIADGIVVDLSATDNAVLDDIADGISVGVTSIVDGDTDTIFDDANDSLKVSIVSGAGSGGTALADDGDFTAGTTNTTPASGFYQTSPTACTDGDVCAIGIDANRNVKVTIEADNAGIGGGIQYDVGDAASATATGTAALVVRDDALSTLADADGDEVRLRVDSTGQLWTRDAAGNTLLGTIDADTSNITTNTGNTATSAAIMDDWDESDRVKVNPIVGQPGVSAGAGAVDNTTQRMTLASDDPLVAGMIGAGTAGSPGSDVLSIQGISSMTPVVVDMGANNDVVVTAVGGNDYEEVDASATDQVLGSTGATGDYLKHLTCAPATTSPGTVVLEDNGTEIFTFTGGADSVSNLVPFTIPIEAVSAAGAWSLTTGTNISCVAVGNFT